MSTIYCERSWTVLLLHHWRKQAAATRSGSWEAEGQRRRRPSGGRAAKPGLHPPMQPHIWLLSLSLWPPSSLGGRVKLSSNCLSFSVLFWISPPTQKSSNAYLSFYCPCCPRVHWGGHQPAFSHGFVQCQSCAHTWLVRIRYAKHFSDWWQCLAPWETLSFTHTCPLPFHPLLWLVPQ